jgi:hypothetical protein
MLTFYGSDTTTTADQRTATLLLLQHTTQHGNGTEEIVRSLIPSVEEAPLNMPFCSGVLRRLRYSPWLNEHDAECALFVSVHGYGKKDHAYQHVPGGWFYPGSGRTTLPTIPGASPPTSPVPQASTYLTIPIICAHVYMTLHV